MPVQGMVCHCCGALSLICRSLVVVARFFLAPGGGGQCGGRIVAGVSRGSKVFQSGPAAPGAKPPARTLVRQQDLRTDAHPQPPPFQLDLIILCVLFLLLC